MAVPSSQLYRTQIMLAKDTSTVWPAYNQGTSTGTGTTTTLTDSTKNWATGQWIGMTVYFTGGTGSGQSGVISANTATQLTFTAVGVAPDNTTTYYIAQARTVSIPIDANPQFQAAALRHIIDQGLRNQPAMSFDIIPGPGEGTFQWGGNFYVDVVPNLLMSLLGTDTKTGTGPYVHTITAATAPPYYSIEWGQGIQPYVWAGCRISQFGLNFQGRDGALTYSVQGMGQVAGAISESSFTIGTTQSFTGYQGSIKIGPSGSEVFPSASLFEGSLTFTRTLIPLHGMQGTTAITNLVPGPVQVQGQFTFEFADSNVYNYFLSATKNSVITTFTQSASAILQIQMHNTAWKLGTPTPSNNIYTMVAQVEGLYNSTDAGPCTVVVTNNQSTAY